MFRDSLSILYAQALGLADLADAFERTGNKTVADELRRRVRKIESACEDISATDLKAMIDRVKAADQATANMINTAVAILK